VLSGFGTARYDRNGNLWTFGSRLSVYAKDPTNGRRLSTATCGFSFGADPASFVTDDPNAGHPVWGRRCPPDYQIPQAATLGARPFYGYELAEDPYSNTMVANTIWANSQILPIRYQGTGANMTFTVGNVIEPGRNLFPVTGSGEQRPVAFDRAGRLWFVVRDDPPIRCDPPPNNTTCHGAQPRQRVPHWVGSIDINQAFAPPPAVLSTKDAGQSVTVQAETTLTVATTKRAPTNCDAANSSCAIQVDSTAYVHDSAAGSASAFELADDGGGGLIDGSVEYNLWVPASVGAPSATYTLAYQVRSAGGGSITASVDGGTGQSRPVPAGSVYQTVAGPSVALAPGWHRLRLTPSGNGWNLDWFTVTPT